ncbi:hypothetical protein SAVCW2_16220 [Streptomyces avermitilis]|nr:hypothetical protein SAVCW2_16220 [Streptomyces avermitilis]
MGGAQGVGGVGGAFGEHADEVAYGVRVALLWQGVADRGPHPRGDGLGSACGQWSAACLAAFRECVEHGLEQRPQRVGAFGT